jgi:hypothetical protein
MTTGPKAPDGDEQIHEDALMIRVGERRTTRAQMHKGEEGRAAGRWAAKIAQIVQASLQPPGGGARGRERRGGPVVRTEYQFKLCMSSLVSPEG